MEKLTFIGFGEAGAAIAEGWGNTPPATLAAYDIKTEDPATAAPKHEAYKRLNVAGADTLAQALEGATCIFSTVTADQAIKVATNAAPLLAPGTLFFDMNSCAPSSKRKSAAIIEEAGGRYVDTAIMAAIYPNMHKTAMLVSGPHAETAMDLMKSFDMSPRLIEGDVGTASTIKMIRSIMVKGMEALVVECVLSAVREGVDEEVLGSLEKNFPGFDWPKRSAYMLERCMVHGVRRAAELREVAKTVDDLGLPNRMATATAAWEDDIGALGLSNLTEEEQKSYTVLANKILGKLD